MDPTDTVYDYAPGVRLQKFNHADCYVGTRESLIYAGLASADQFPGQPGVGVHCAKTYPDGTHPANPRGGGSLTRYPGAKSITKFGKRRFKLLVYISLDESERRHREQDRLQKHRLASELRRGHHTRTENIIDFAAYKARQAEHRRVQW